MFGMLRKNRKVIRDRTVYMEVCGANKVAYRVIAGKMTWFGEDTAVYGIEAEDMVSGESETIPDFSRNIEDAVDFAEMLISDRTGPRQLYSRALNYLCISI